MKTFVLMVGPAGSGKSTLAQKYISNGFTYINQDSQGANYLQIFDEALLEDKDIVLDRMNYSKNQRKRFLDLAKSKGYKTQIFVLHQDFNTCLERCSVRLDHPTIKNEETAYKALRHFFTKYERVEDDEADFVIRLWPELDFKPKAVWIDIDGTLSDPSHRQHFVRSEKKNWDAFFSLIGEDKVNEWCKNLINMLHTSLGCQILICTARPEKYRTQTIDWLNKNDIKYDELIMRRNGDFREDSTVKEIMYEFEIKTRFDLLFSVDDRKQVVDKIRSHGVTVLDCAGEKGNF